MLRRAGWALVGIALLGSPVAALARCEAPGSEAPEPDGDAGWVKSPAASGEPAAAAPPDPKPAAKPPAAGKAARRDPARKALRKDKATAARPS